MKMIGLLAYKMEVIGSRNFIFYIFNDRSGPCASLEITKNGSSGSFYWPYIRGPSNLDVFMVTTNVGYSSHWNADDSLDKGRLGFCPVGSRVGLS